MMLLLSYLSLIASIGLMRIALMAGMAPAALPKMRNTAIIHSALSNETWKFIALGSNISACAPIIFVATCKMPTAKQMPAMPAMLVSMALSAKICAIIDLGVAPMARRMPNSFVRYFTIIHMMLPTPMMPAISELKPTKSRRKSTPLNILFTFFNSAEMS